MKRLGTALVHGAALAAFALPPAAIGQQESAPAPRALSVGQSLTGELSQNDRQRRTGKFEDVYLVEGRQGERVDLRLLSDAFDPVLVVNGPQGFSMSNDDEEGQGQSTNSRLVLQLPASGTYRVSVTSFRSGETGAYRLQAATATSLVRHDSARGGCGSVRGGTEHPGRRGTAR